MEAIRPLGVYLHCEMIFTRWKEETMYTCRSQQQWKAFTIIIIAGKYDWMEGVCRVNDENIFKAKSASA